MTRLSYFLEGQFTKIIERYRRHFTIVTRENKDVAKDLVILASLDSGAYDVDAPCNDSTTPRFQPLL